MASLKKVAMTADEASTLALRAVAFLGSDPQRLTRFLSLTGTGPVELRAQLSSPSFQAAVIDHFLTDESLLLVAAADLGVEPEAFAKAHALLLKAQPHD